MGDALQILLIEDDSSIREVVKIALEFAGVVVRVAEDGLDGLKKLQESVPDLILLDFMMPRMNGREFVDALEQMPGQPYSKIPILLMSAAASEADPLAKRVRGVLKKPIQLDDLLNSVNQFKAA